MSKRKFFIHNGSDGFDAITHILSSKQKDSLIVKMNRRCKPSSTSSSSVSMLNVIYLLLLIVYSIITISHQDAINQTTIVTTTNSSSMNNKNSDRTSTTNNNRLLPHNVAGISNNNNKLHQDQQLIITAGDAAMASATQQQSFRIDTTNLDHQSQLQLQQLHNNNQMSPMLNGLHSTEFTPIFPSYESQNQHYQNSLIASGSTPRLHQISHHNGFHSANLIPSNGQQQSGNATVDDLLSSV